MTTITLESGWTSLKNATLSGSPPLSQVVVAYNTAGDTTPSFTTSGGTANALIALEIRVAPTAVFESGWTSVSDTKTSLMYGAGLYQQVISGYTTAGDNTPSANLYGADVGLLAIELADPSSSGPLNPSSSVSSGGTVSWATPSDANESDNVYTTHTVSTTAANMPYLNTSGYGFNIPSNATIKGITVVVEKKYTGGSTGNVRDNTVQLMKAGSRVGSNLAVTGTNWSSTDTNVTYGGNTNLWGTTWTPAEINDSAFGVSVRAVGNGTGANRVANIDNVRITVSYIAPLPTGTAPTIVQQAINTSGTTTLPSATTAGNTLLVIATYDPSGGTSSITDSKGNTVPAQFLDYGTGITKYRAWLIPITTAGASHSITGSFGTYTAYSTISVYELSGAVTVDTPVTASAYDTTSPYEVTSGYPSQTNNLLFAIIASEGSDNVTFSASGWTKQNEFADFTAYWGQSNFTKVGGSGQELFSATMSANSPDIVSVFGLKQGTGSNPVDLGTASVTSTGAISSPSLQVQRGLSASLTGTSNINGTLAATRGLSAALTGSTTITASLGRLVSLSAAVTGSSTIEASLSAVKELSAAVVGTSTISSPTLDTYKQLSADPIQSTGTITASLSVAKELSASLTGSTAITAKLDAQKLLSAEVQSTGSITATLSADKQLSAQPIIGTTTITATLGNLVSLEAQPIVSTGTVEAGAIELLKTLEADSIVGTTTIQAGTLLVERGLSAAVAGTTNISAALSVQKGLAASLTSTGTITAALSIKKELAAQPITSTGQISASLSVAKELSAEVIGTSVIDASGLQVVRGLAASVSGSTGIVAGLSVLRELNAALTGATDIVAAVEVERGLAAVVEGNSDITALLALEVGLAAQLTGATTITAALSLVASFRDKPVIEVQVLAPEQIDVQVLPNGLITAQVIDKPALNISIQ